MRGRLVARPTARAERRLALRDHGWFSVLPDDFQSAVLELCEERKFDAGESVCEMGDESGGIFGVLRGSVGCWISSRYAEPTLGHIVRRADWFGEGPALTGQPRTMGFRALEPTVLLQLGLPALRRLAEAEPTTPSRLGRLGEHAARVAIRCMCDLLIPDAERRLAAVLLRVTGTDRDGFEAAPEGFRLSQSELGEMVGFSRHHCNRLLLKLQGRGLIGLGYHRIAIIDQAGLVALAIGELSAIEAAA